ncbi:dehydrogenase/reductase SDR family member 4-like isoform X1 [Numida meleagris]|uniref:dehydrogenase/reductase SDR family member 4-like isoform X1 n=1 Tax=Numida meleagris TaxID=8996 RepID=UPI000B3E1E32|nr:dehydrogenase/reductase SDR family member 4-like isoform X1 [Numida meleagris]
MLGAMGRAGLRALSGGGAPNSGRILEGKVALVTASTDGIGLAVAERLGAAGARVLLSSRRQPHVDAAVKKLRAQGLEASGVVCHVGQPQDRQRLVQTALDTYGAIDILVSNAAVNPVMGSTLEAEEAAWEKIFQVNVTAAAMLVKLVVPHMEKRGGGAIVFVTSVAGYMPFPALGPYSVSKTALLGLVKVLAPELRARGVRLNAVAPGLIQTRFSAAAGNAVGRGRGGDVPLFPRRLLRGGRDHGGGWGGPLPPLGDLERPGTASPRGTWGWSAGSVGAFWGRLPGYG